MKQPNLSKSAAFTFGCGTDFGTTSVLQNGRKTCFDNCKTDSPGPGRFTPESNCFGKQIMSERPTSPSFTITETVVKDKHLDRMIKKRIKDSVCPAPTTYDPVNQNSLHTAKSPSYTWSTQPHAKSVKYNVLHKMNPGPGTHTYNERVLEGPGGFKDTLSFGTIGRYRTDSKMASSPSGSFGHIGKTKRRQPNIKDDDEEGPSYLRSTAAVKARHHPIIAPHCYEITGAGGMHKQTLSHKLSSPSFTMGGPGKCQLSAQAIAALEKSQGGVSSK